MPQQLNPMCKWPKEWTAAGSHPQIKHEASRLAVMLTAGCLTADEEAQAAELLRRIPELEDARDVAVELTSQYAAERDQLRNELSAIKSHGARVPATDEWITDIYQTAMRQSLRPQDRYGVFKVVRAAIAALSSTPTAPQVEPPMQPIVMAPDGVIRFRENRAVSALLEHSRSHGFGLNELAQTGIDKADHSQLQRWIPTMSTTPLYILPNGMGVQVDQIKRVHAYPSEYSHVRDIGPRIVFHTDMTFVVDCESYEAACALRDELIAIRNGEKQP